MMYHRRARYTLSILYFLFGSTIAHFAARIPDVQQTLQISDAELGIVLLGSAVGLLIGISTGSWITIRIEIRRVIGFTSMLYGLVLPLLLLSPGLLSALIVLVVFGLIEGTAVVSLDSQAVEVEKETGRTLLPTFHAWASIGSVVGAIVSGWAISQNVDVMTHFLVVGPVSALLAALSSAVLPHRDGVDDAIDDSPAIALPKLALLGLGTLAFCSAIAEGAVSDWSAVYLATLLPSDSGFVVGGFAGFSLTMAIVRLYGTKLIPRMGARPLVRYGGLFSALGFSIALLANHPILVVLGFTSVGAGLALVFLLSLSTAGHAKGMSTSKAVAATATMGYMGFFIGPPLIGALAEFSTIRSALIVVVLASVAIAVFASHVGSPPVVQRRHMPQPGSTEGHTIQSRHVSP